MLFVESPIHFVEHWGSAEQKVGKTVLHRTHCPLRVKMWIVIFWDVILCNE
jgi:hypothetical protein